MKFLNVIQGMTLGWMEADAENVTGEAKVLEREVKSVKVIPMNVPRWAKCSYSGKASYYHLLTIT